MIKPDCFTDDSDDDLDQNFNDDEDQVELQEVKGLFCDKIFSDIKDMFKFEADNNGFNIVNLVNKFNMSMVDYFKMINYLRLEKPEAKTFLTIADKMPWNDDKYLKTVLEDDPALQFDIEEDLDILDLKPEINNNYKKEDLVLKTYEKKLKEKESQIEELLELVSKLRTVANKLLTKKRNNLSNSSNSSESESEDEDSVYINSYSNYNIHLEMLQDKVRTEGYMNAILDNKDLFKDKVVLDVGCGSGILSLFAAKAGAKMVIAVDMSNIIDKAVVIAKENGYEDKIKFLKGKMEQVELPVDTVDIIISEWMGYFLLFESMLDSVLFARDKYLNKKTGLVLPNYFDMNLFGVSDTQTYEKTINFWSDVYGFKMSAMKKVVQSDAQVQIIDENTVVTNMFKFKEIDCLKCTSDEISKFETEFCLTMNKDAKLTGIGSSFDTFFNHESLLSKSSFSTSPFHKETHWQQTLFQFEAPVDLKKGDLVKGRIKCWKNPSYLRSYIVELNIFDRIYTYKVE